MSLRHGGGFRIVEFMTDKSPRSLDDLLKLAEAIRLGQASVPEIVAQAFNDLAAALRLVNAKIVAVVQALADAAERQAQQDKINNLNPGLESPKEKNDAFSA